MATPGRLLATPVAQRNSQQDPLLRTVVHKNFGGKWYRGQVVSVDVDARTGERAYHVAYDDGDEEHMTAQEVGRFRAGAMQPAPPAPQQRPPRGVSPCKANLGPVPMLRPCPTPAPAAPSAPAAPAAAPAAPAAPFASGAAQGHYAASGIGRFWLALPLLLVLWRLRDSEPDPLDGVEAWDRTALNNLDQSWQQAWPERENREPHSPQKTDLLWERPIQRAEMRMETAYEARVEQSQLQSEPSPSRHPEYASHSLSMEALLASTPQEEPEELEELAEWVPVFVGAFLVCLGLWLCRSPGLLASNQHIPSSALGAPALSSAPVFAAGAFYVATAFNEDRVVQVLAQKSGSVLVMPYQTVRCLHTGKVTFRKDPGDLRMELANSALREGPFCMAGNRAPCRISSLFEYAPIQQGALLERSNIIDLSETPKPEFRHARALKRLQDMGFTDSAELREVISANNGHVGGALRQLGVA